MENQSTSHKTDDTLVEGTKNMSIIQMANQSTSHKTDGDIKNEIRDMVYRGKPILDFLTNFPIKRSNNEGVVYVLNVKFGRDPWSKLDEENIKVLFEKMGFRVELIQENTFEEIQKRLEIIRKSDELKNARMFIMFLLSWGGNHYLSDINGKKMDINDVFVKSFLSTNCPALVNKPKLFFIDASRENTSYKGIPMEPLQAATEVFKIFSTSEGGPNFIYKKSGSLFIRCLVLTILNFFHKKSLKTIFQISNSILSSIPMNYKDNEDFRQIPVVESILTKAYFFSSFQDRPESVGIMKQPTIKEINKVKKEIEELITSDVDFLNFNINYKLVRPNKEMDDFYPCESEPRGVVYVWNIRKGRLGSEVDVKNIEVLFEEMGYSVEVIKEDTTETIKKKLDKIKESEKLKNADMFIMFLMSHGTNNHLMDINNKEMNIKEVFVEPFNPLNCPSLKNKPKLFFIQACRGIKVCTDNITSSTTKEDSLQPSTHPDTDIFIFFSTTKNYVAIRYSEIGSLFIRCLLLTISKFCHQMPLNSIVNYVNAIMSSQSVEHEEKNVKQISIAENSLTKDVFFSPYEKDKIYMLMYYIK